MMYGEEKSDSLIVAAKQANNPKGAESVERRSGAKGNAEQPHMRRTQSRGHCCKVSDEAAFCLIQRPYISKTLLTRRISPRGSP